MTSYDFEKAAKNAVFLEMLWAINGQKLLMISAQIRLMLIFIKRSEAQRFHQVISTLQRKNFERRLKNK